jgi:hypothetical protein
MSIILPQKFKDSIISTILVYVVVSISMNYIGMSIVVLEWNNMIGFY